MVVSSTVADRSLASDSRGINYDGICQKLDRAKKCSSGSKRTRIEHPEERAHFFSASKNHASLVVIFFPPNDIGAGATVCSVVPNHREEAVDHVL